jgi:hypothetical protein
VFVDHRSSKGDEGIAQRNNRLPVEIKHKKILNAR